MQQSHVVLMMNFVTTDLGFLILKSEFYRNLSADMS